MEEKKDEEDSTMNEGEATIAIGHALRLVESGVQACDIGIITPYSAQVSHLSCPYTYNMFLQSSIYMFIFLLLYI